MKARIKVEKSFDEGMEYSKSLEAGDFAEFFGGEGGYLDRLSETLEAKGKNGDSFTVIYTVQVSK